jgi:predicted transcriptional regulator
VDALGSAVSPEVGPTPAEIREMLAGYVVSKALLSGIELGVFDALANEGPQPPDALARRLGLPPSSLQRLLIYLCSRGLLVKRGESYTCSLAS